MLEKCKKLMGHLAVWKVLEEMVADLKKRGVTVPAEVIRDLKNARTIITILKADPDRGENAQKVEECLANLEIYLVTEGQRRFGQVYVDEWLERRDKAGRETVDEEEEETRFITGMPRGQKWIRLMSSEELPAQELKVLAEESHLSLEVQVDGSFVVFGPDTNLKDFVRKIAAGHKPKTAKTTTKST
jgi:hypothetical protein